jgi:hypothetical protein
MKTLKDFFSLENKYYRKQEKRRLTNNLKKEEYRMGLN